jgi:hypothetical protein
MSAATSALPVKAEARCWALLELREVLALNCLGLLVVKGGNVGDPDDQAIFGEKPDNRLPPRFGTGPVQQLEAGALKLLACRFDSLHVL